MSIRVNHVNLDFFLTISAMKTVSGNFKCDFETTVCVLRMAVTIHIASNEKLRESEWVKGQNSTRFVLF